MAEKYAVREYDVAHLLDCIKNKNIAIPEIQRPFVWKPKQVRDLIDSLYKGYPTGFIVISKSPNLKLKDGTSAPGLTIMIDGQQRVTALMAALVGWKVLTADFEEKNIKIAYNPFAKNEDDYFAVQDNAILKDKKWIPDISILFSSDFKYNKFFKSYCKDNPENGLFHIQAL